MKISKHIRIFAIILGVLFMVAGCQKASHGHAHGPDGEHTDEAEHHNDHDGHGAENEQEPIARTEFSEELLNFFEFAPLKPQRTSSFLIHLTELQTGEPVAQADVKLIIKGPNGKELDTVQAKVGLPVSMSPKSRFPSPAPTGSTSWSKTTSCGIR